MIPQTAQAKLRVVKSLAGLRDPLASPAAQLEAFDALALDADFDARLAAEEVLPLMPLSIDTLQINVGKLCNQTCKHCHVDAGPDRTESMSKEIADACIAVLAEHRIPTLDITGGAPELNPNFRSIVEKASALGCHVIDRCNLTILHTGTGKDLPEFFAKHRVEVVCSLPHYRALNTDKQRGDGVFDKSIEAMRRLNAFGYGNGISGLKLVVVTNPVGAFLPASQQSLEKEWKRKLKCLHDVEFDSLYTITNMPISRYLQWLIETDNLEPYMQRLVDAFNPDAAQGVMCRNTLSVAWDGSLYDCDFNQMLELELEDAPNHIHDFDMGKLLSRRIRTASHCFGCTAGAGSSCGGTTGVATVFLLAKPSMNPTQEQGPIGPRRSVDRIGAAEPLQYPTNHPVEE